MSRLLLLLGGVVLGALLGVGGSTLLDGDEADGAPDEPETAFPAASGTLYEDVDGNGLRGEDEPRLAGVRVVATTDAGLEIGVLTGPEGTYRIESPEESFRLRVDPSTLPAGSWELTSSHDQYRLRIPPDYIAPGLDFGYQQLPPGTAEGVVFEDLDGSGQQEDGEPGLADVTVVLTGPAGGTPVEVTTGADGRWRATTVVGRTVAQVDTSTLPARDGLVAAQTTEPGSHVLDPTDGKGLDGGDFGYQWVPVPARDGSAGGSTPAPTDEPTDEPTPEATETAEPDACALPGEYDLREQPFLDQISALGADEVGGGFQAEHLSGTYLVTLREDGTYTSSRADWTFRFATPEGAIVVTVDSDDSGTWSASGDQLSISEPTGEADVSFGFEQGGRVVPLPIAPTTTVGTDAIAGTGTYECRPGSLAVTFEGVTSILDRIG